MATYFCNTTILVYQCILPVYLATNLCFSCTGKCDVSVSFTQSSIIIMVFLELYVFVFVKVVWLCQSFALFLLASITLVLNFFTSNNYTLASKMCHPTNVGYGNGVIVLCLKYFHNDSLK